jgi:hypothetical protein
MSEEKTNNENEIAEVIGIPAASILETSVSDTLNSEKIEPDHFSKVFSNVGRISIKPFIDSTKENMGLEQYGMAVFPGTHHEEQIAALEINGVVRYVTGLDEYAPEVQNIKDKEQKEAVIYNIRSVVSHLEKMLATNVIEIEDKEFWSKVKLLRPDNHAFWGKISLRCGNEPVFLEPSKDPFDLIKFMAIEAGGFDLIAKSYDDALAKPVSPKFYLDKEMFTVSQKTTHKRLKNKAVAKLDEVANKNVKKLLYMTKILDTRSASYKKNTQADVLYDALDEYINGNGVESNKSKAAENFLALAQTDMETLKLRAVVKDASYFKTISLKPDGMLYHTKTSTMLGRNVSDVVLYLKNPLNEEILTLILNEVENYWGN